MAKLAMAVLGLVSAVNLAHAFSEMSSPRRQSRSSVHRPNYSLLYAWVLARDFHEISEELVCDILSSPVQLQDRHSRYVSRGARHQSRGGLFL